MHYCEAVKAKIEKMKKNVFPLAKANRQFFFHNGCVGSRTIEHEQRRIPPGLSHICNLKLQIPDRRFRIELKTSSLSSLNLWV